MYVVQHRPIRYLEPAILHNVVLLWADWRGWRDCGRLEPSQNWPNWADCTLSTSVNQHNLQQAHEQKKSWCKQSCKFYFILLCLLYFVFGNPSTSRRLQVFVHAGYVLLHLSARTYIHQKKNLFIYYKQTNGSIQCSGLHLQINNLHCSPTWLMHVVTLKFEHLVGDCDTTVTNLPVSLYK